jgi:putative ABC transport system ATP-binding protein
VIEIKDLYFRWSSHSALVLEIPRLSVLDGESVFIKGPSGSGKSTLLNLIGGVLQPTEGELVVLGQRMSDLEAKERDDLRGNEMGFIFQQFNLLPYLTVMENILLPVRFSKQKSEKLNEQGLEPEKEAQRLLSRLGLDWKKIGDRKVTQLSVGQQQRVAAARALIGSPGLIIADEPTSSLDADARTKFVRLLMEESRQIRATLLFVSHDGSLASEFTRTVDLVGLNRAFIKEEFQ